jgi:hypothetical protein
MKAAVVSVLLRHWLLKAMQIEATTREMALKKGNPRDPSNPRKPKTEMPDSSSWTAA